MDVERNVLAGYSMLSERETIIVEKTLLFRTVQ